MKRPNLLYIMSDDHAAHAISAYGSAINQTPNLDRIARGGMLLNPLETTNVFGRSEYRSVQLDLERELSRLQAEVGDAPAH